MSLAKKQKKVLLSSAFSGVQEPLKAGAASPFLQRDSGEPCVPPRAGEGQGLGEEGAGCYKSILSTLRGSATESCAGLSRNPDKCGVGKDAGSILVLCSAVFSRDYSSVVRQKVRVNLTFIKKPSACLPPLKLLDVFQAGEGLGVPKTHLCLRWK